MKITLLLSLLLCATQAWAQNKTVSERDKQTGIVTEYQVKKAAPTVKDGSFKQFYKGKRAVTGTYKQDRPVGVFTYYGTDGLPALVVDYDKATVVTYTNSGTAGVKETATYPLYPTGDRPSIAIASPMLMSAYLRAGLRYPDEAVQQEKQGTTLLHISIDETGKPYHYSVAQSADTFLDAEAMRFVQSLPLVYLPAYQAGKPIKDRVEFPISFALQ